MTNRHHGSRYAAAFALCCLAGAQMLDAAAIRPGFNTTTDGRNDDGTYPCTNPANGGNCPGTEVPVNLGLTANFFGVPRTQAYINTNGNITFDAPLSSYTPFGLTSTTRQIIAPFFADVDTRTAGNPVAFGTGTVDGRNAFGVDWVNVDYFDATEPGHTNRDSFQLVLIDRSDTGAGNFDIEFNYDQVQWETGTAGGGGINGLGGQSAHVGYSNGTGLPGTDFELPGSGTPGTFLDGTGSYSLITHRLNSDVDGRYVFQARNGTVIPPPNTPEPGAFFLLGGGLAGLALLRRRRARAGGRA